MRCCIAAFLAMLALPAAALATARSPAGLEAYVDGLVSAVMAEHRIPGLVISIVGDDRILLSKGYGIADADGRVPPDPSATLFRIGSVTKTFTWLAVMQLAEQGRLDLHADVNDYLKELRIAPWEGRPLTLHDLMAHRAGFEETGGRFLFETDPDRVLAFRRWLAMHAPRRVRAPGEAVAYSNYGTTLAGAIVENVSGMPLHEYLETRIFEPLGMRSTTILEPVGKPLAAEPYAVPSLASGAADFSAGFVQRNGVRRAYGFEFASGIAPAGAGSSTAHDMARYMLGLLKDEEAESPLLLRPETVMRMRERSYPADERVPGFAHGFLNGRANGQEYFGHGGITTTFSTTMLVWPSLELGVFVSINQRGGAGAVSGIPLAIQEYWLSSGREEDSPGTAFAPTASPEHSGQNFCCFDGYYLTNRRAYTTLAKFDYLARGFARVSTADDGTLLLARGADTSAWLPLAPLVFTNALSGAVMAFEADTDGRVRRFNDAGGYDSLEKMPFAVTPRFLYLVLAAAGLAALGVAFAAGRRMRKGARRFAADYAAIGLSAAILLSVGCFAAASGTQSFAPGWPPASLLALVWISNLAALLSLSLLVLTLISWRSFRGTGSMRFLFLTFACIGIAMTAALDAWNLVGLPSY